MNFGMIVDENVGAIGQLAVDLHAVVGRVQHDVHPLLAVLGGKADAGPGVLRIDLDVGGQRGLRHRAPVAARVGFVDIDVGRVGEAEVGAGVGDGMAAVDRVIRSPSDRSPSSGSTHRPRSRR